MVTIDRFGTHEGKPVWRATLTAGDLYLEVLSFGAITKSLQQKQQDLILGYDDFKGYLNDTTSMGVIAGRVGNRISSGQFDLNGKTYNLEKNDGAHHLHGGSQGFGKRNWTLEKDQARNAIQLGYLSGHLEAGYPEELDVSILITLTETELTYQIDAVPTGDTPVNLLQHNYYCLARNAQDHVLTVNADSYCESDTSLIPTGRIVNSKDGLDFRSPRRVGDVMPGDDGIDHNFVLNPMTGPNAVLSGPKAKLEFTTDQPGLQVYTGQSLGKPFQPFQGICLEPQNFPNSVNQPDFPSCIYSPENPYHQMTRIEIFKPI